MYIWKYLKNSVKCVVSTYLLRYRDFSPVLNFWRGRKNHVSKKVLTWYIDFAFHVGNHVGICRMSALVRKTALPSLTLAIVLSHQENWNCCSESSCKFETGVFQEKVLYIRQFMFIDNTKWILLGFWTCTMFS